MFSHQHSVQFSSVAQSCPTLCNPMNCSTPGLPVHHQLQEFTQTHIHWVGNAIQPSHPLSSFLLLPPTPPSTMVFSNESILRMKWPKYWSFSFSISPSNEHPGLISHQHTSEFIMISFSPKVYNYANIKEAYPLATWSEPRAGRQTVVSLTSTDTYFDISEDLPSEGKMMGKSSYVVVWGSHSCLYMVKLSFTEQRVTCFVTHQTCIIHLFRPLKKDMQLKKWNSCGSDIQGKTGWLLLMWFWTQTYITKTWVFWIVL